MNYQTQAAPVLGGQHVGAPDAVTQPALHALCDRLEKQLAAMAEGVQRTKQFSMRLMDPRPENVGKDSQAVPQPSSVEGRLRHLVHVTESINAALHNVAAELERAA